MTTIEYSLIDEDMSWSQTVGGPYKGRIYSISSFYSDSLSPVSVTKHALARFEQVEDVIHTHIHTLNEELRQRLQQQEERFRAKEVCEVEDSREEGREKDRKEDPEADVEILSGSAGQLFITSSFSMATNTRPAIFIVFFFYDG